MEHIKYIISPVYEAGLSLISYKSHSSSHPILQATNNIDIHSPLDQFDIINFISIQAPVLGNISFSLTNIALYLTIAGYLVFLLSILSNNNNMIISNP